MQARSVLCALLSLGPLLGCAGRIDAPPGYVEMRDPSPYDFKAVSARGSVIALRSWANEHESGDLQFWSDAVEYQKVDLNGLRLIARDSITTSAGKPGTLLTFELGEGQGKYTYLVALFVTPTTISVIEAAGPAELIEQDAEKLRRAIESFR